MVKSDMRFKDVTSLNLVNLLITDIEEALKNPSRKIQDSSIKEVVIYALNNKFSYQLRFNEFNWGILSLYPLLGKVSTGLIAGGSGFLINLAKAPMLRKAEQSLYQRAITIQSELSRSIKEEAFADNDRISYLDGLNILLQKAIEDLIYDLEKKNS